MDTVFALLELWAPFIILMSVWLFFMRRMGGGADFRNKCLEHMAGQTEAQRQLVKSLERIATALEQRKP